MLIAASEVEDCALEGLDQRLGTVTDLLLEAHAWAARYLVVGTEIDSQAANVLIAMPCVEQADWPNRALFAKIMWRQVQRNFGEPLGPTFPRHIAPEECSASPQWNRREMGRHYSGVGMDGSPRRGGMSAASGCDTEPQLCRAHELCGFEVLGTDGPLGLIDDLLLDTDTWNVRWLMVKVAWLPSRHVLLSPDWVDAMDHDAREVAAPLTRAQVASSPRFDVSRRLTRADEERLHQHYDQPRYWRCS